MFPQGYSLHRFPLDSSIKELVLCENWLEVDQAFQKLTEPGAPIFELLQTFHSFSKIEIMISIRDGANDWEEDGIWHDDSSRVFAFSLSITPDPASIRGGHLELRKKNSLESVSIPTPEFGTAILFLTGVHGYEHRTRKVEIGRRIILVGWCSQ